MVSKLIYLLLLPWAVAAGRLDGAQTAQPLPTSAGAVGAKDFLDWPEATNALRFRIWTNAALDSSRLMNTFELEAYGELLLRSPGGSSWHQQLHASPSNAFLHGILINGAGPRVGPSNSMTLVERASGPEWSYVALDGSRAYADRLKVFRRGLLFVQPDLFVLYDHVVGKEPVTFQLVLHPPAATTLDPIWHDLRLEDSKAGFRIQTPAGRHALRSWERVEGPWDGLVPGTVTMRLGPTNKVSELNLLTVFAVYQRGATNDYAFKLLESNTAVGARIHRAGWPTLVAFRLDPAAEGASLTGFRFQGPAGVDVFRPKRPARR
jgi:hypothetical protein